MDVYRSHAELNSHDRTTPEPQEKNEKKDVLRTWAEQLDPVLVELAFSFLAFVGFLLLHESHLDAACQKMFHLAFRPVVDSISCSVSPFPLHVTFFFFGAMLTLRKSAPEKSGGFLLCDEVEVCPSAKTV